MPRSFFDLLNHFIRKRYRWVIIAWVVAVLLSLVLIPSFFSSGSYNLTGGFAAPSNTESDKAASILQAQFPTSANSSDSSILVVIQGAPVYSDSLLPDAWLQTLPSPSQHRLAYYSLILAN